MSWSCQDLHTSALPSFDVIAMIIVICLKQIRILRELRNGWLTCRNCRRTVSAVSPRVTQSAKKGLPTKGRRLTMRIRDGVVSLNSRSALIRS